jgi:replicative DNA helicase
VQSLLLRLGINASILRYPQVGKGRDQYHVKVSGKPEVERFFELIGSLGKKKVAHQTSIEEYYVGVEGKTNRDVIPAIVWSSVILPAMQSVRMTKTVAKQAFGYDSGRLSHNISREIATNIAEILHSQELNDLAQSDIYWDQIISIDAEGEENVFDLTVDTWHNFVANDITLKNSIEQDADIVMFIYRDDLYNPESERKNIANLILAKHRNGPVGEVSLYFQASQTRFRDLEASSAEE